MKKNKEKKNLNILIKYYIMNNIIINLNNIYIYSLRFGSNLVAFPNT